MRSPVASIRAVQDVASLGRMPLKDTPALRRLVASALEAEDEVDARVLPGFIIENNAGIRCIPGDTARLSRRHARQLADAGSVELLD